MKCGPWSSIVLSVGLTAAACGKHPQHASPAAVQSEGATAPAGPHTVTVFATASLRAPFTALARQYEQDHPGAQVSLRCAPGQELLAAMQQGERCDVLAIGDNSLMSRFAAAAMLGPGVAELARNRIAIAVAAGNPRRVQGLADLLRSDLRLALGVRAASIGRHGRWVLSRLGQEPHPEVEAQSADAVLARVAAGEADAGIVYATTATIPGVELLAVPEADNTPVLYSIAVARDAPEPRGAAAFAALARSATGQRLLHAAGFLPPGAK